MEINKHRSVFVKFLFVIIFAVAGFFSFNAASATEIFAVVSGNWEDPIWASTVDGKAGTALVPRRGCRNH